MREKDKLNLTKMGIFIFILFAIFVLFTLMLNKERSLFEAKSLIKAKIENAQNLKIGAQVKLKGIKIGTTKDLVIDGLSDIIIEMEILSKYLDLIREDSYISVETQGMLGDKYVEILGGSEASPSIKEGDFISVSKGAGLKDFISKSDDLLNSSNIILGQINELLTDLNNRGHLVTTLQNFSVISTKINKLFDEGKVDRIFATAEVLHELGEGLNKTIYQVNHGPGTAYSFLYDNSVYEDLQILLGGAQRNKVIKYFIRESIKKAETLP